MARSRMKCCYRWCGSIVQRCRCRIYSRVGRDSAGADSGDAECCSILRRIDVIAYNCTSFEYEYPVRQLSFCTSVYVTDSAE
eukprot:scaffold102367_cov46-Prasinocladus_malaysianus.AAC.1